MTRALPLSLALALLLVACDDGAEPTDSGPQVDAGPPSTLDSGPPSTLDAGPGGGDAGPGDDDAGPGTPDAGPMTCGDQRPDVSGIRGTEGLVIARDGTIYYSQNGAVGRLAPGGSPENRFVDLSGDSARTVWGLVLDAANETLYVGAPGRGVYVIDVTASPPTFTRIDAGSPNGLTLGPDGALYWSEFSMGAVMRNDLTGGASTTVTTSPIRGANGIAFADDGSLYVASYATGTLFQLRLQRGTEMARATAATGLGSPDGVALDQDGNVYVTDNSSGTLLMLPAGGGSPMTLETGVAAAASIEFGAGPLTCTDIYVASSGRLRRHEMGTVAGRAVPWH